MSDRAVSEVVSYVLVFALITSSVAIVSVSGLASLQDTRNAEQINNAERAYDVLDDNLADIYRRDAPSRATEVNLGEASLSAGGNISITVSVDGTTVDTWLVRPLIYSGEDDRRLVYEAGAIFRANSEGQFIVSEPPFILQEDRVLISVVGLNRPGIESVGGSTALVRAEGRNSSVTKRSGSQYNVTVENTQHADLWYSYFDDAGGTCPTPPDDDDTAIGCEFSTSGPVYVVYHDIYISIDQ